MNTVTSNELRVTSFLKKSLIVCFPLLATGYLSLVTVFASSGASFLKIPVGARAQGMASAYTAIANDVTSLYWNPAGLSGVSNKELSFMHAELFADTRMNFLGYAMPLILGDERDHPESKKSSDWKSPFSNLFGFGVGMLYLSQGEIEARDENRKKNGSFSANDFAVTVGISRKITKRSNLGISLKFIQQNIASEKATNWATDFGFVTKTPRLNLALALLNTGAAVKFDQESYPLPFSFSMGVGYKFTQHWLFSFDYKYSPNDKNSSFALGQEFYLFNNFSIRTGYSSSAASLPKSSENKLSLAEKLSGFSTGIGIRVMSLEIDYAFNPTGNLGNSQRVSLLKKF